MRILKLVLPIIFFVPVVACCSVEITDIKVKNSMFSPNGDGVLDSTFVSFNVGTDLGWAAIWVWVTDGGGEMVRTLADDEASEPGTVEKAWDGRTTSGGRAPEGYYTFRMYARAGEDTTSTFSAGSFLDVTAPSFSALINPNPYTPDLPMADSLLTVKVFVEDAEPDDWLSISVMVEESPETLCTRTLEFGDTTYECTWDGRSRTDGVYSLSVMTYDRAGNRTRASYAVDLDTQGPSLEITDPVKTNLNAFPERVTGSAFDRGGIDSLGFRFLPDSEYGPVVREASGDSLYWYALWPDDLLSDGTYKLQIYARDLPGHTATSTKEVVIDTQAPTTPVIASLPAQVSHPNLTVSGTCSARDSLFLYLNGEIENKIACSAGGTFSTEVTLVEGANSIQATARDKAGNVSPPSETYTVTYTKAVGIRVPERLDPDSVIDITLAKDADMITVRIYTLEGSYVATVSKPSPDPVDEIAWNLKGSDGEDVKNGVYLLVIEIDYSDGGRKVEKEAVLVAR